MAGNHPRLPTEDIYRDTEREMACQNELFGSPSPKERTAGVPQAQKGQPTHPLFQGSCHPSPVLRWDGTYPQSTWALPRKPAFPG